MSSPQLWRPIANGPPVFILDASASLAWLVTAKGTQYTDAVVQRMKTTVAAVPQTWASQLADLVRRRERAGQVNPTQVSAYFVTLSYFGLMIDGETNARVWCDTLPLARTHNIAIFDAAYLELALRLGLPLATIDTTLTRAANAAGVPILIP